FFEGCFCSLPHLATQRIHIAFDRFIRGTILLRARVAGSQVSDNRIAEGNSPFTKFGLIDLHVELNLFAAGGAQPYFLWPTVITNPRSLKVSKFIPAGAKVISMAP